MQCLELVLECTHRFSVCAQHYDQVLSNPILYPQWALCNHYETVETKNQSSHQSFYSQRRSQAVTSVAPHSSIQYSSTFFSPLNLIFSSSLWLWLFSSLFLTQYPLLNLATSPLFLQNVYVNINRIMSVGNRLLESGHYASQQIKQISSQLEKEWKAFAAALDERSTLLEMSASFHQKCDQVSCK